MTTYLLDANVLIAVTLREHEHHDRVATWSAGVSPISLWPIVEDALVRFFVRIGESRAVAAAVLHAVRGRPASTCS